MKIYFSAESFSLTPELEKYASGKAMNLARRLPRKIRAGADCRVQFTQRRHKGVKFNTCSVSLQLPGDELRAAETTQHMYAALDIAVVHIEQQIREYEARHKSRLGTRLKRQVQADWRLPSGES